MKKLMILLVAVMGVTTAFANDALTVDELLTIAKDVKVQLNQTDAQEIVNFLNEMYILLKRN